MFFHQLNFNFSHHHHTTFNTSQYASRRAPPLTHPNPIWRTLVGRRRCCSRNNANIEFPPRASTTANIAKINTTIRIPHHSPVAQKNNHRLVRRAPLRNVSSALTRAPYIHIYCLSSSVCGVVYVRYGAPPLCVAAPARAPLHFAVGVCVCV